MTSTENMLQTLQRFIQDVLAPDVRELKVKVAAMDEKMDLQFKALMSAISNG